MSKITPVVTALQRQDSNLFYSTSKFKPESNITSKLLIMLQKDLIHLILKSIFKFQKFQKNLKMKMIFPKLCAFVFLHFEEFLESFSAL